jgi:glycosyltransferase involved in cell wall biosynthesis
VSWEAPSFDLVVATVDRQRELSRLLDSLEAQEYPRMRVILVDQNDDDRAARAVEGRQGLEIVRLESERGLSRARNVALEVVTADLVAFPDDDCIYPGGLLRRVAERLADGALDGLTGRAEDAEGASSASWKTDPALLSDRNLWNRAISFTIFLRHEIVRRVGPFDERLGVGAPWPWSSGEETDYLVRAVRLGARIEYDPSLVVQHPVRIDDTQIGLRDGASLGFILRKHRYPPAVLARMLVRPIGGVAVSLARCDRPRAAYNVATLRGRVRGYRGARASKISA